MNFPLKQKFEVVKILENFVVFIQTQSETVIKIIRSDNETKFFMTKKKFVPLETKTSMKIMKQHIQFE